MNLRISRLFSDGALQSYERGQRPMKIMKVLTLLLVMFNFMITHLRCKAKNFSKYLRPPHPTKLEALFFAGLPEALLNFDHTIPFRNFPQHILLLWLVLNVETALQKSKY